MNEPNEQERAAFGAEVDQHMTAMREAARRWPNNVHLTTQPYPDERIVRAMFAWWLDPPSIQFMKPGGIYIVWMSTGSFTSCPPGFPIELVARENAPWKVMECDLCRALGAAEEPLFAQSFLLVGYNAWLFAFALCGACSYSLGADKRTRLIRPDMRRFNA